MLVLPVLVPELVLVPLLDEVLDEEPATPRYELVFAGAAGAAAMSVVVELPDRFTLPYPRLPGSPSKSPHRPYP